jgi:glutathione peroxidase-family protein
MNEFKYLFILIFFAFSGIFIEAEEIALLGKPAPDFKLTDSKGKQYSISEFKGKFIVLEWINFGCPFVKKHYESKNMQKLQKSYTEKGIVWLTICSSTQGKQGYFNNDEINAKIKESGAGMTAYLIDEDGTVGRLYGAKTTPNMFIIDKSGNLVYMGAIDDIKSTDAEDIAKANNYIKIVLDELMNDKPQSFNSTVPYGCSVKYK